MWTEQCKFCGIDSKKRVECWNKPGAFVACSLSRSVNCHNFFFFSHTLIHSYLIFWRSRRRITYTIARAQSYRMFCDWFRVIWLPFKMKREKKACIKWVQTDVIIVVISRICFVARQKQIIYANCSVYFAQSQSQFWGKGIYMWLFFTSFFSSWLQMKSPKNHHHNSLFRTHIPAPLNRLTSIPHIVSL